MDQAMPEATEVITQLDGHPDDNTQADVINTSTLSNEDSVQNTDNTLPQDKQEVQSLAKMLSETVSILRLPTPEPSNVCKVTL
jgi:hypothetical protein